MSFDPHAFVRAVSLLFVLLNPFLMSIYLLDLLESLPTKVFISTVFRGAAIATAVFCVFGAFGDAIFSDVLQVRFASFLIFGGIVFLVIALHFVQAGPQALAQLRGAPKHLAGSVAMPFMIGPGTVSASVIAGARLPLAWGLLAIVVAMCLTVIGLALFKWIHTLLRQRNNELLERYVDLAGRGAALLIGTFAIDMMLSGIEMWWRSLSG